MEPQDFLPPDEAFNQSGAKPKPFLDLSNAEVEEKLSAINRVTYRLTLVRERGGENPQVFPEAGVVAVECPVDHREAGFFMPDKLINGVWQVNTGWIEEPTIIVVLNKTAWKGVVKPTKEQKDAIANCIVEVGFDGDNFPISLRPEECQPLFLKAGQRVYVRSASGNPTISVFAV